MRVGERSRPTVSSADATDREQIFDVCVYGAGIIGMFNALQYARRGMSVALVDELSESERGAYKVGESLLTFSSSMLRSICDLDEEIKASFEKRGLWFMTGYEGRTSFDGVTEWAEHSRLPASWVGPLYSRTFGRTLFQNAQIVRPEIEAVLRERIATKPLVRVIDTGRVIDVEFGRGGAPHVTTWRAKDHSATGTVRSRWVVDCSGRRRFLSRRLDLSVSLDDGFVTSAVWGQFANCTDESFQGWEFTFPGGESTRRDYTTVHMWGDGYWIWLIRLSKNRISVGVSLDRRILEGHESLREVFWTIIRRYPSLDFLTEDNLLDFSAYKNIQHISEVYVSPDRFVVAGDAASIIDAYYSQGMSQAMVTSWHGANVVERDLKEGRLDLDYIERINRTMKADWFLIRSIVKHKFSPASQDSRFFILDHLLDYVIFAAVVPARHALTTWLVGTSGGDTSRETTELTRVRARLERRLFLNRSAPLSLMSPEGIVRLVDRVRTHLERNARWRLESGIRPAPVQGVLRPHAPFPAIWRIPIGHLRNRAVSITPSTLLAKDMKAPDVESKLPLAFRAFAPGSVPFVAYAVAFDSLHTAAHRFVRRFSSKRRALRSQARTTAVEPPAVEATAVEATAVEATETRSAEPQTGSDDTTSAG